MIPYYSPNYHITDFFKSITCNCAEQKLYDYFYGLTGKKYSLITSSCRSALFLAYMAIGKKGIVHTSPLTCKVALMPIIASGNRICFHDVKTDDWTIDPDTIPPAVTKESTAIQAIHLGGFPCDMYSLRKIADEHGLILVEDCAQGFSASFMGVSTGTLGDISCFTLCKNVFGIGGGVLATNNLHYYEMAKTIQRSFPSESILKVCNRVITALISSSRNDEKPDRLYMSAKKVRKSYTGKAYSTDEAIFLKELRQPPSLYVRSFACRISQIERLNELRKSKAAQIIARLSALGCVFQNNPQSISSYTKLFTFHKCVILRQTIENLNLAGLEAMHLEHKTDVFYQDRLTEAEFIRERNGVCLNTYNRLHDYLVSLPLYERMNEDAMDKIVKIVGKEILSS